MSKHKKAFVSLFKETARNRHRYEVFRDFVTMAAISLHNSVHKVDELENEYLSIVKSYDEVDVKRMPKLLSFLVLGLEEQISDFLGDVFMDLELGSGDMGQFFTPYHISKLMADLQVDAFEMLETQPFITVEEPTCGAGGMVIALVDSMIEKGLNPQKQLWVRCTDIDHVAAMMCFVQLSLLHVPAKIVTGNSLTLETFRVMRTPAHYLGFWEHKLRQYWSSDEILEVQTSGQIDEINAIEPMVVSRISTDVSEQLSFF